MEHLEGSLTAINIGCPVGKKVVDKLKSKTWKKKDEISETDVKEIVQQLTEFPKLKEEFLNKMPNWKRNREETIPELYRIANECNKLHKDCNISNVTGSSVGAVGALMELLGIALAPVTFGASLGLTIAGVATGYAGGATNIITSIVESSKMKDKCKAAQNCLDKDRRETEAMNAIVEKLMGFIKNLDALQKKLDKIGNLETASIVLNATLLASSSVTSAYGIAKSAQAVKLIRSFTAAEISVLKECPKMMKNLKALKGTALVAGKLTTCLAVASLGISIYEIVTTSIDIHNGSETKAAAKLRENAKTLQEQKDTLCAIERTLRGQ